MNDRKHETLKQNLWTSFITTPQEDPEVVPLYPFRQRGCPFSETEEIENTN